LANLKGNPTRAQIKKFEEEVMPKVSFEFIFKLAFKEKSDIEIRKSFCLLCGIRHGSRLKPLCRK
jgi:hypothetical protein